MQVTLGEEGSGFSKPRRFPPVGNIGDWAPLRLPLAFRRRLTEVEREVGVSRARPGLRIDDLEEIFIEEEEEAEERREVKQMNREGVVVVVAVVVVVVRWGRMSEESIISLVGRPLTTTE